MKPLLTSEITQFSTFVLALVLYGIIWFVDIVIRDIIYSIIRRHKRGLEFWTFICIRTLLLGFKVVIIIHLIKYILYIL